MARWGASHNSTRVADQAGSLTTELRVALRDAKGQKKGLDLAEQFTQLSLPPRRGQSSPRGQPALGRVAADQPPQPLHGVEGWADREAFDAHVAAPETKDFRAHLAEMTGALYDERLYRLLGLD
jgi:hypothetical protein